MFLRVAQTAREEHCLECCWCLVSSTWNILKHNIHVWCIDFSHKYVVCISYKSSQNIFKKTPGQASVRRCVACWSGPTNVFENDYWELLNIHQLPKVPNHYSPLGLEQQRCFEWGKFCVAGEQKRMDQKISLANFGFWLGRATSENLWDSQFVGFFLEGIHVCCHVRVLM